MIILKKASYKAIKYACLNFHYAKSVPTNVFGYSVYNKDNEWCGVILFGSGANRNSAKKYNMVRGKVIELVRVALNGNIQPVSQALGLALKLVKKDIPLANIVVSYADIDQNHQGIIYKATNWIEAERVLCNKKDGSYIIDGKRIHNRTVSAKCQKNGLIINLESIKKVYKTEDVVPYVTKGKIKFVYPLNKEARKIINAIKV